MYADRITDSMQRAIEETDRRRTIQTAYNVEHNITPTSIDKEISEGLRAIIPKKEDQTPKIDLRKIPKDEYAGLIKELSGQMDLASANLEFEKAAELRDIISDIKSKMQQNKVSGILPTNYGIIHKVWRKSQPMKCNT